MHRGCWNTEVHGHAVRPPTGSVGGARRSPPPARATGAAANSVGGCSDRTVPPGRLRSTVGASGGTSIAVPERRGTRPTASCPLPPLQRRAPAPMLLAWRWEENLHPRALLGWVGVSNLTLPSSGLLLCHQPRERPQLATPILMLRRDATHPVLRNPEGDRCALRLRGLTLLPVCLATVAVTSAAVARHQVGGGYVALMNSTAGM